MIVIQFLLCVIILYLFTKFIQIYKFQTTLSKIPTPPGHWLVGNVDFLLKNPPASAIFDLLRENATKYWPIYRFWTPYIVTINLLHPSDLEIVLSQPKHLSKSKVYKFLEGWLGKGLLTSTGSKWQTRRKILTRAFHFNILQQFLKVFNEETQHLVEKIAKINEKNKQAELVSIIPIVTNMTLQSISETAMGLKNLDEASVTKYKNSIYRIGKLLLDRITSPLTRSPLIYPFTKKGKEERLVSKNLHDFTYKIIKEREEQILNEECTVTETYSKRKNLRMLDLLLLAKINENSIDYEGIREEVDTFMFEGHDTTASAISFLLLSLAQHRNIQEEVRKEILSVVGNKEYPSYNDLQELSYTERVIKECLRVYPSVPFISRVASEDFVSHTGYLIPKGTVLHIHIFDLHRNPQIYPDPLKFDPDRFLPENCIGRHPFAYLPFSAGPRNCIGQKFAMLEIKSVISGVLRNYKLEPDETTNLKFFPDLVLRTENDINLKFIPV